MTTLAAGQKKKGFEIPWSVSEISFVDVGFSVLFAFISVVRLY
jgi:hypothetical protein